MTAPFLSLAAELKAKAAITPADILSLRRICWPDGRIDPAEAEAIFDLNEGLRSADPEWVDFFVEAMSDYVVRQAAPAGYVDDAKADWLIARIDGDGRVDSLCELELLVKILEAATNAPDSLKAYALAQIEAAVLTGAGPTRCRRCPRSGLRQRRRSPAAAAHPVRSGQRWPGLHQPRRGRSAVPHQGPDAGRAQRARMGQIVRAGSRQPSDGL